MRRNLTAAFFFSQNLTNLNDGAKKPKTKKKEYFPNPSYPG